MERIIKVHDTETNLKNWIDLAKLLRKVNVNITSMGNGIISIEWDDTVVEKTITREAGNNWVREDILIEDVITLMKKYWRKGTHKAFPKEHLQISYSTFRKRMLFFKTRYGGLQEAVDAGCKYFTDRPDGQGER